MTRVLVFDSGVGGLTVQREIARQATNLDLVYLADDAGFPYGAREETDLCQRIVDVIGSAIEDEHPDCVVIACNTASTLALGALRDRFAIPFVGTVPAIKPAAAASTSGRISVLATSGTIRRDYTADLIADHAASVEVTLVAADALVLQAEHKLHGDPVDEAAIFQAMRPAFVDGDGQTTDHIALACTHFPLLIPELERLAPWPVTFIDPAPAIARRVTSVLGDLSGSRERRFLYTSGRPWIVDPARFSD